LWRRGNRGGFLVSCDVEHHLFLARNSRLITIDPCTSHPALHPLDKLCHLPSPLPLLQPANPILNIQLRAHLNITQFHPSILTIQCPSLHNSNPSESLCIALLINLRPTVLTEMECQCHATRMGHRISLQVAFARGDCQGSERNEEVRGVCPAGDLAAGEAVAENLITH
jgi:hypothetical protein